MYRQFFRIRIPHFSKEVILWQAVVDGQQALYHPHLCRSFCASRTRITLVSAGHSSSYGEQVWDGREPQVYIQKSAPPEGEGAARDVPRGAVYMVNGKEAPLSLDWYWDHVLSPQDLKTVIDLPHFSHLPAGQIRQLLQRS